MMIETIAPARAALAEMLIDLSITSDFVFLINGDSYYDHGFSLCNRLGMQVKDYEALLVSANLAYIDARDKFKIPSKEWESFLSSWLFDDIDLDRPRFVKQQLDLDAILNSSTPDSKKRNAYYSLQLGMDLGRSACQNICEQINLSWYPPHINNLRAKQRGYGRAATPFIVEALCNNDRLYERCMGNEEPRRKRITEEVLSPPTTKRTKQSDGSFTLSVGKTPSPQPQHVSTTDINETEPNRNLGNVATATPTPHRQHQEVSSPSDIDAGRFPLLAKFREFLGDEWDSERSPHLLFDEIAQNMQDGSVLNVTDKRGHQQCWVNIPVNDTDKSHSRRAKEWIEPIIQTNGKNSGSYESAVCTSYMQILCCTLCRFNDVRTQRETISNCGVHE
jgi:hypothetical protein